MSFEGHCKSLGIELLSEDVKFIRDKLKRVSTVSHKSVLSRYADAWVFAMNTCVDMTKAQNVGRRAANEFLRENVK